MLSSFGWKGGLKMLSKIKRLVIGKPLKNEELEGEKYGILWGLPILSSDAISSVAYGGQEILIILIPALGVLAYKKLVEVSIAIILLLLLLMLSYRQTIDSYPNGGGAYIVAKENLGKKWGVLAGAALSVDYVLTVAVSISSGVEQLTTAFDNLKPYAVLISILIILFLMLGNLRGIRESSKLFGLPAYAFIVGIVFLLAVGAYRWLIGDIPKSPEQLATNIKISHSFMIILLLKAFSNGCSALTGVEAISNAVPNFKNPSTKHAKTVLLLLSIIILVLFGGTALLANVFHVIPGENAYLILLAESIVGKGFVFYYILFTTLIILSMAANTAFSGFPLLISVMAKENLVPRSFSMRGDRLSFDDGIVSLGVCSIILVILFKANVTSLIGLYAIGVFISFTLSQSGMFMKWIRGRQPGWKYKATINGLGALVTAIVVVIVAITKFTSGVYLVVIILPILMFLMFKVEEHYSAVAKQLKIKLDEYPGIYEDSDIYRNRVIVPLESVNQASIRALRYATTISDVEDIVAFNVAISEEDAQWVKDRYSKLNTQIPLIIYYSPYRKVYEPLLEFIASAEYDFKEGDLVTVILPKFETKKYWHELLHDNATNYIAKKLGEYKHIVVAVIPLQLDE